MCTSNVCRSPPAAALAHRWLQIHHRDEEGDEVISRSLTTAYEPENSPASEYSIQIMKETYGIDISSHRSKLLSEEDVRNADIIIGITASHREHIVRSFPEGQPPPSSLMLTSRPLAQRKTISMPRNVPDPWHGPFDEYVRCLDFINSQMDDLFASIDSRHK